MEVDPLEYAGDEDEEDGEASPDADTPAERHEKSKSRLNTVVAITIALIATFMGVCNVKDGNIVQQMQMDQADKIDNWSFYQARNVRQSVYESTVDELKLQRAAVPPALRVAYDKQIAAYAAKAADQAAKKQEPMDKAKKADDDYNAWNRHDDQFDLSEALLSIAIALLATTSLTQKRWLYVVALVPTGLGTLMGLAGLFGWGLHSDFFARVLGT